MSFIHYRRPWFDTRIKNHEATIWSALSAVRSVDRAPTGALRAAAGRWGRPPVGRGGARCPPRAWPSTPRRPPPRTLRSTSTPPRPAANPTHTGSGTVHKSSGGFAGRDCSATERRRPRSFEIWACCHDGLSSELPQCCTRPLGCGEDWSVSPRHLVTSGCGHSPVSASITCTKGAEKLRFW
jgi:hypothetical protein